MLGALHPLVLAAALAAPELNELEPTAPGRLSDRVRPLRYELDLRLTPALPGYSGRVSIELELDGPERTVLLHARSLTIDRAEVTQDGVAQDAVPSLRRAAGASEPDVLALALARPLRAGRARLELAFHTTYEPRLNGLYRVEDGGEWYVFTQMEPVDARRGFPCFDEPAFKVPWQISITVPEGQLAFSNAPEVARTDHADATTTFRFAETPPMSSYLVALAAGPLEVLEGAREPLPLRLIAARGKSAAGRMALEASPRLLAILTEYFGRPFPYSKLDLVALPEFVAGAMENPGLITFREEFLLVRAEQASTDTRRFMMTTLAHEFAHQWFGDLVTMKWWDDIWLNEGFATWMAAKVMDRFDPSFRAPLEEAAAARRAMRLDTLPTTGPVRQPVASSGDALAAFDSIRYAKGGAVLGMIESRLGEETFRAGVRSYLDKHAWGNADSQDLIAALASVSGSETRHIATSFLDQPGVPLVHARLECTPRVMPRVVLRQSRFGQRRNGAGDGAGDGSDDEPRWTIPVNLSWSVDDKVGSSRLLLTQHEAAFELPSPICPDWIHHNAGEAGYYRLAFERDDDWRTPRTLGVGERVALLDHALALVEDGALAPEVLLDLAASAAGDPDRTVAAAVAAVLDRTSEAMIEVRSRPALAALTSELFGPLGRVLGFVPRAGEDDETRILREVLFEPLRLIGEEPWLLSEAEQWAPRVLDQPGGALPPDAAGLALALGSRYAGAERFAAIRAALAADPTPSERLAALRALGNVCDAGQLRRNLDFALTPAVRAQDVGTMVKTAFERPENRDVARAWMVGHEDALLGKLHPWSLARLISTAASTVCSAAEIRAVEARLRPLARRSDGGELALERGLEEARGCLRLRTRSSARVGAWLAGRTAGSAAPFADSSVPARQP